MITSENCNKNAFISVLNKYTDLYQHWCAHWYPHSALYHTFGIISRHFRIIFRIRPKKARIHNRKFYNFSQRVNRNEYGRGKNLTWHSWFSFFIFHWLLERIQQTANLWTKKKIKLGTLDFNVILRVHSGVQRGGDS